jgi:hypothetical protein
MEICWGLLIGLGIGIIVGAVIMACCAAAGKYDEGRGYK